MLVEHVLSFSATVLCVYVCLCIKYWKSHGCQNILQQVAERRRLIGFLATEIAKSWELFLFGSTCGWKQAKIVKITIFGKLKSCGKCQAANCYYDKCGQVLCPLGARLKENSERDGPLYAIFFSNKLQCSFHKIPKHNPSINLSSIHLFPCLLHF